MPALLKCSGLHTLKNNLSEIPEGALTIANNVNVNRDSIIEPRRGFKTYGDELTLSADRVKQLLTYKGRIIRHFGSTLQFDSDGVGSFSTFDGSFSETETGLRIKGIEANSNFYFTTSTGIKKISATSSSEFTSSPGYVTDAGIVKALDMQGVAAPIVGGFMLDDESIAYRLVWAFRDTNNNLILGSPSARVVIQNISGGNADVTVTITVPPSITTDHFYQLYRTTSSSPATSDPGDEMNLVDEGYLTVGEIAAGFFVRTDITPEDFRVGGTLLYTNPVSGSGILQSNDSPPLSKDIALFKGSVFYANTTTLHRKQIGLLSVSGFTSTTSKLAIGNINVVREYTFRNAGDGGEDVSTQQVFLSSAVSPAQAVDETARSLVKVINRDPLSDVFAYYLSGPDDIPGLILLENVEIANIQFFVSVNEVAISDKWNPDLPVDATPTAPFTSSIGSDNEVSPNRVFYSKFQIPEAVPIVNYIDIGPRDKAIKRIIALRDSLFVFKEDGVYRISGSSATTGFSVTLFDGTTTIRAPDSAVELNNQIYVLMDDGVSTISDTGIGIISRAIEDKIEDVTTASFINFSTQIFGIAYHTDKSYTIWLPSITADVHATQAFRYNTFTSTWTRWTKTNTCGIVNEENNRLYLGAGDVNFIEEERKSFSNRDAADREFPSSIISADVDNENVLVSSTLLYDVGDVISQTQTLTISKYNRLLKKLDLDPGISDSDYYSSLYASAGDDLALNLLDLTTKLDLDSGVVDTDYNSSISGLSDFTSLQLDFNIIIDKLNLDVGVTYSNYKQSVGTITFDSLIRSIDVTTNRVYLSFFLPLLAGDITLFKSIETEIQWAPFHFGDPSILKQVSEGTILFEENTFSLATISYSSDLNPGFIDIQFENPGNGFWGMFDWGALNWGGEGNQSPLRTLVPLQTQRCRFLNVKFKHRNALEIYGILGVSLLPRSLSSRAYK